jgi:hypothetical protein
MKALVVKQPLAWCVVHGVFDSIARDWGTGYRGRVYVYASEHDLPPAFYSVLKLIGEEAYTEVIAKMQGDIRKGAVIGEVDIVGSEGLGDGLYQLKLASPAAYDKPVSLDGAERKYRATRWESDLWDEAISLPDTLLNMPRIALQSP